MSMDVDSSDVKEEFAEDDKMDMQKMVRSQNRKKKSGGFQSMGTKNSVYDLLLKTFPVKHVTCSAKEHNKIGKVIFVCAILIVCMLTGNSHYCLQLLSHTEIGITKM